MKISEKKRLYFDLRFVQSFGFCEVVSFLQCLLFQKLFLFYSGDMKRVAEFETIAFKREVFFSEGSFL